jgi:hypothetical protein
VARCPTTWATPTVNIIPPAQFLSSYVFFTDPTYAETNLVIVRGKATDGTYHGVTLDCVTGALGGWQPIGASAYQFTRVDLQHAHATVGKCTNGTHTIVSDSPFGITVWGFDTLVSYAYPAGASVHPINGVVVGTTPN